MKKHFAQACKKWFAYCSKRSPTIKKLFSKISL